MATSGVVLSPAKEESLFSPRSLHGRQGLCSPSDGIHIYLAAGNSLIPMRVLASDTIASVKLRIQAYKGFVVKQQKLVHGGRELARNDSLVKDYGVTDGNVLHLVLRLSDLQVVTVKTVAGKEFVFQLERSRSIRDLKQRIAQKESDLGLDEQELIFKGKQLEDQRLLDDLSLENDVVVHLFVRKTAKLRPKAVGKDVELSIIAKDEADLTQGKIDCDQVVEEKPSMQVTVSPRLPLPQEPKRYHEDIIEYHKVIRKSPKSCCLLEPVTASCRHKLSPTFHDIINATKEGLESGRSPIRSEGGSGGAYFMQDSTGTKYIGVFKPIDEEPMAVNNPRGLPISLNGEGLKKGTRVGEGAYREVAAYILDHPINGPRSLANDEVGFAGVPPTMMIRCRHTAFYLSDGFDKLYQKPKMGSLQKFVESYSNCEDMGPAAFPVDEVHKITVLDMRLANADRHGGNILVCKQGEQSAIQLVPIDHGYCLPENFEDCTFDWMYWPQARQKYKPKVLRYIESLDADKDIELLRSHGWTLSLDCSRVLRVSTMLLKKGAAAGLSPYEIANIMCRESLNKTSEIENILEEAQEAILPASSEAAFLEAVSQIMDRYLAQLTASKSHDSLVH
eukprot:Gb_24005 [translate_table: standard]